MEGNTLSPMHTVATVRSPVGVQTDRRGLHVEVDGRRSARLRVGRCVRRSGLILTWYVCSGIGLQLLEFQAGKQVGHRGFLGEAPDGQR